MLFSAEHNALIYKADPRLTLLDGMKVLNGHPRPAIAVPASLENLQSLRSKGFPVIPPMELAGYDWPIRHPWTVLDHQRTTANFLVLHPRSFCFNDMGTMKTLSALWAADFLMRKAEKKGDKIRALVVAPLSILKAVWGQHIFNHFTGRRTYRILHGSHESRVRGLAELADFYIINHDGLACGMPSDPRKALYGLAKDLIERPDIQIVIFDEGSVYRSGSTQRHRAARIVVATRSYCWCLTGTPTPNGPLDAHGLAKLMGLTNGESYNRYRDRVMIHMPPWRWVPRPSSAEAVKAMLSPAIRFNSDFLNLPPVTAEMREVAMSTEQKHAWTTLKKEAVLALRTGSLVHAVNEAALRIKLIQVAAGVVYDGQHASHDLNPIARIAEVESVIAETSRKIVIFAPLTNVLNLLYSKLDKHERVILNGATSPGDRVDILRRFGDKNSSLKILLADPTCIAHGVNELVSASCVIWYAPTDKNELYRQGIKRLDRPGQTGPVKVVQLVSTKLEREIYQRLDRNESLQGLVLKFAEEK